MSQAKGVGEWAFISSNETSVEDKRRNRQNARAHTARVIRQRQRIAKQGASTDDSLQSAAATASGPPPSSASQPSSSTSNALAVRGPRDISFGLVGRERDDGRQFTARRRGLHQPNASSGTAPTPIESTPLERSVSPTFGGLSVDTFGTESPGKALEAANYCMKIDWPNLLTPDEAAVWCVSGFTSPLLKPGADPKPPGLHPFVHTPSSSTVLCMHPLSTRIFCAIKSRSRPNRAYWRTKRRLFAC